MHLSTFVSCLDLTHVARQITTSWGKKEEKRKKKKKKERRQERKKKKERKKEADYFPMYYVNSLRGVPLNLLSRIIFSLLAAEM